MFSDSPTSLKRKAMSLTQTYYLAHTARGKLSTEAARADHNLRLLVGHANLLDSLMLDLASAEQEQESWFNQSVQSATKSSSEESPRQHIQWADAVVEDPEEDWDANDADSSDSDDSDYDEDEDMLDEVSFTPLYRTTSHSSGPITSIQEVEDDDEYEDDDEEDYAALSLTPSPSHSASPPELSHDSDSESEDDSMPPSPPSDTLPSFSEKQQIATTSFYNSSKSPQALTPSEQSSFLNEGYFLPPRSPQRLVSAISVY